MTATLDAVSARARAPSRKHAYKRRGAIPRHHAIYRRGVRAAFASATARTPVFDSAASWLYEGMAAAYRNGAARLAITGNDPSLLSKEDPEKSEPCESLHVQGLPPGRLELITRHEINWTIVALRYSRVGLPPCFPDPAEGTKPLARLWEAIFAASRRRPGRSDRRMESAMTRTCTPGATG